MIGRSRISIVVFSTLITFSQNGSHIYACMCNMYETPKKFMAEGRPSRNQNCCRIKECDEPLPIVAIEMMSKRDRG